MPGRHYTQPEKDAAVGALMSSSVLVDGQWVPNWDATSKNTGVSRPTLTRWWEARDVGNDVQLRAVHVKVSRLDCFEYGSREWIRGWNEHINRLASDLVEDKEAWKQPADKRTKALLNMRDLVSKASHNLPEEHSSPDARSERLAAWMERMGLNKPPPQKQGEDDDA